jgi:ABC-type multidrug transport system fused ATPase/permease subunit
MKDKFNLFVKCINLVPPKDKTKLYILTISQSLLGLLDVIGVALVGIIGMLSINGFLSITSQGLTSDAIKLLGISNLSMKNQVGILAIMTVSLFLVKTALTLLTTRKLIFLLAKIAGNLSSDLVRILLSNDLNVLRKKRSQDALFSLTGGVNLILVGFVGGAMSLLADFVLILFLGVSLFFVQPQIMIATLLLFFVVAYVTYRKTNRKISKYASMETKIAIRGNENILSIFLSFREIHAKGVRQHFIEQIKIDRLQLSNITAELTFLPTLGKYAIEVTLILSTVLVAILQFSVSDVVNSVGVFSVFLAASGRIAPASLRLQQGFSLLRRNIASARSSLEFIEFLRSQKICKIPEVSFTTDHDGFSANIELSKALFMFQDSNKVVINNVNLSVCEGEFLAIIGPTGSGKSTLIDLILGLFPLNQGTIEISGLPPAEALIKWPGAVGYVPQQVSLSGITVRDFLTLGFEHGDIPENLLWNSLETAQLKSFVSQLEFGLDSEIGEQGNRLSGGQKQRLGIARALVSQPKLIILDESTSSLDSITEQEISRAISELKGSRTIVVIAHRLGTVRNADRVIYLEEGQIKAEGTFDQIRESIPEIEQIISNSNLERNTDK